ncbi:MAG TPA: hypothetical protein VJV78_37735 [Polyangiales bacterium]|nr:hypothetical protein [Polyangiales bacterium]
MDDLGRTIATLRDELTPAWNDAHGERLLANIDRLQRRRRFKLLAGGCALTAAFASSLVAWTLRATHLDLQPKADPLALMEAADVARKDDRPQLAAEHLRRLLRDHAQSPEAPFAAFTLGRVLLENLGEPAESAAAFALVRAYAPEGSLAQDALAREVEALSKAGHSREAYQRARLYLLLYPSGRRLHAVRLFGGLE